MSPETEERNVHGEKEAEPPFGYEGSPEDIKRQEMAAGDPSNPAQYDPQTTPLMDSSDPRGQSLSNDELKEKEQAGKGDGSSQADKDEKAGLFSGEEKPGRFSLSRVAGRFTRRRVAGIAVAGVLGVGGLSVFSIAQGPLQFIHLSQNAQKLFRNNEDFGNDRMSKSLLYGIIGKDITDSRLGVVGNRVANIWEKKLLEDTGLRPVYQDPGRRFVGFEVVDERKAAGILEDLGIDENGNRNQNRAIRSVNEGRAELVSVDDVTDRNDTPLEVTRKGGEKPDGMILNLAKGDFKDRRAWIKVISKATKVHNIVGSQGARLLINRAGVKFHVFEKLKQKTDEAKAKFKEKRNKDITNGSEDSRGPDAEKTQDSNDDGEADTASESDEEASRRTKDLIRNFKLGTLKTGAAAAAAPVAVVGVLCAVKSYGDSLPEYKFNNIAKPMMRLGTEAISMGDQVKSFDDFNLETMGIMVEYLHDRENNTSFNQSEAYQATVASKEGGVPPTPEMELRNINEKPQIFEMVDSLDAVGLGAACSIQEGIFGLPVIRNVVGVADSVSSFFINRALGVIGTSQEEILNSSLKIVAGQSVDPEKTKGAAYGNAAIIGADLAANDTALAMGGGVLADSEVQELASLQAETEQEENQSKSFFARYFDPVDSDSMLAAAIDASPSSTNQFASLFSNPFKTFSSITQSAFSFASPEASAQARIVKDYGFKRYGFSLQERNDERFENPYTNANIVEDQLDELNEKYSACFGVKIVIDESTDEIKLENGNAVNIFNLTENGGEGVKNCNKPSKTSPDYELFQRYRFYIADAITALSLSCYYDESCVGIDVPERTAATESSNQTTTTNPNIFVLGDSLTVGMRDLGGLKEKLEQKGWQSNGIEATVSRTVSLALSNDIDKNRQKIEDSGTVVIALGTNDGGNNSFKSTATDLINKVRSISPDTKIYWMNAYGGRNAYESVNGAINQLADSEGISVINWAEEYRKNPRKYPWSDPPQIHHTNEGYSNKASFLVESIGSPSISNSSSIKPSLTKAEAQQIARRILDSGKVTIVSKYQSQIQNIASGDFSCNVNPTILQLIQAMSEKHTIRITSINRMCTNTLTASGTGSYHYREGGGHAVDIDMVDGVGSTGGTSKDIELLNDIANLLPSGSAVGQSGCRSTRVPLPEGVTEIADSCNHIHIQVPTARAR